MRCIFFCFFVDEKIKLKVLACPFELTDFENPFSNPLRRPKSGDFDTENACLQKAACDQ
jgi:hypothetical protein